MRLYYFSALERLIHYVLGVGIHGNETYIKNEYDFPVLAPPSKQVKCIIPVQGEIETKISTD